MIARALSIVTLALLVVTQALAAGQNELQSGPQVGEHLPGPLYSVVAYSAESNLIGKKTDFNEMFGQARTVLVFARQMTNPLANLIKKLDAEANRFSVVVVHLSDDAALEASLKDFGERQGINHVILTIAEP